MYSIFAFSGLLLAAAASLLPETFRQDFPDTAEDMERRPRQPYFSWKVWETEAVPTQEVYA